jgi:hypothetical protein
LKPKLVTLPETSGATIVPEAGRVLLVMIVFFV